MYVVTLHKVFEYVLPWLQVHKQHYASDDLHLGRVLTKCGYFIPNHLEEAKQICKGRSEQDYAEILYNLGEKSQYEEISKCALLALEAVANWGRGER